MPFWDRHWRVRAVAAAFLAVNVVLFPWRYLATVLPLDTKNGRGIGGDILIAVCAGLLFVAGATFLAVGAVRAQDRTRQRDSIRGQGPISPTPRRGKLPRGIKLPLELTWPSGGLDRGIAGFMLVFLGAGVLLVGFATIMLYSAVLLGNGQQGALLRRDPGLALFLVAFFVFMPWVLVWSVRPLFTPTRTIRADMMGITETSPAGNEIRILWDAAQLLEIGRIWVPAGRGLRRCDTYTLYSHNAVIRWTNEWPKTTKMSKTRYADSTDLLSLVEACTGLTARRL